MEMSVLFFVATTRLLRRCLVVAPNIGHTVLTVLITDMKSMVYCYHTLISKYCSFSFSRFVDLLRINFKLITS